MPTEHVIRDFLNPHDDKYDDSCAMGGSALLSTNSSRDLACVAPFTSGSLHPEDVSVDYDAMRRLNPCNKTILLSPHCGSVFK